MKKLTLLLLMLVSVVFSSCYTYKVYPVAYRKLKNEGQKPKAYITNSSLEQELEILSHAQLFTIVTDSADADIQLRLYPLEKRIVCGQGTILSLITIGQLPTILPDKYMYQFDEVANNTITNRKLELEVAQRIWFWDMFVFNKRFEQHLGQALLGEYKAVAK